MNHRNTTQKIMYLVELAIFAALVILLQSLGSFIKIGAVSISLVLVPIVLGGMLLGVAGGTILGFIFGAITLIAGIMGTDGFTFIIFNEHPVITTALCLGKATAAGFVAALLFRVLKKKHTYLGVIVGAAAAPIVNTGLFILGSLLMAGTLKANFVADGQTLIYFLVIVCAGVNFIAEFALNIVVSPALYRIITAIRPKKTPDSLTETILGENTEEK